MMSDEEIIAVVQAHKEGKQIQCRNLHEPSICHGMEWFDAADQNYVLWNFVSQEYRVKPEPRKPREWWVHVEDGEIRACLSRPSECYGKSQIRVREVIDE